MTSVPLNVWAITNAYNSAIKRWIRRAIPTLMQELKKLTPEDTKEMLNSYRIEGVEDKWDKIVWTISNDAEHAIYVEYGVEGLTFNYHKPKWGVFYRWIGNRTFARAVDNARDKVMQIIFNSIDKW